MRQTSQIKDLQIRIYGKGTRVFQGIEFKTEIDEEGPQANLENVTDVTGSNTQENIDITKKVEEKKPVSSAESVTTSRDMDKFFPKARASTTFHIVGGVIEKPYSTLSYA